MQTIFLYFLLNNTQIRIGGLKINKGKEEILLTKTIANSFFYVSASL
jgi:hypothetical protein